MFDPTTDPLGLGLQARARDRRWQDVVKGNVNPIGPLPDPQWDAFFQAVKESNPGKRMVFQGGARPMVEPTDDPGMAFARGTRQFTGAKDSDEFNALTNPALRGLKHATKGRF